MSNASNNLYQIEKLNNKNFSSWKFKVQMVLKARKLWKYIENSEVNLSNVKEVEGDQEALSQIALTVGDPLLGHIRNAKSAHETWKQICSVFEQKGLSTRIFLRRKLINLKLDESVPMQSHISEIRELADQLESIGDTVKDTELAIILLCSLPERYNPLIITLEGRPANEITFDSVSSRLLAEEERQKESGAFQLNSGAGVFFAGKKNKYRGKLSSKTCSFCQRTGHTVENCWDKNGRPERKVNGNDAVKHAYAARDSGEINVAF